MGYAIILGYDMSFGVAVWVASNPDPASQQNNVHLLDDRSGEDMCFSGDEYCEDCGDDANDGWESLGLSIQISVRRWWSLGFLCQSSNRVSLLPKSLEEQGLSMCSSWARMD